MLSYIQRPDNLVTARLTCDVPDCSRIIAMVCSADKMLSEICVLAITEFEKHGWRRNHPVPMTQTRYKGGSDRGEKIETYEETAIREGDCCPSCAGENG